MTTIEKLQTIRGHLLVLLEIASTRTRSEWVYTNAESDYPDISASPHGLIFAVRYLGGGSVEGRSNADFVIACAATAEVAWYSTLEEIDKLLPLLALSETSDITKYAHTRAHELSATWAVLLQ